MTDSAVKLLHLIFSVPAQNFIFVTFSKSQIKYEDELIKGVNFQ